MKKCRRCRVDKTNESFSRDRHSRDGLQSKCKDCKAEEFKSWRLRNIAHEAKRAAAWYQGHRLERLSDRATWRNENRSRNAATNYSYFIRRRFAPGSHTKEERRLLFDSYLGRCAYCFSSLATDSDHIQPLSRGGCNHIANIAPSCTSCNSKKGKKTLLEFMASGRV